MARSAGCQSSLDAAATVASGAPAPERVAGAPMADGALPAGATPAPRLSPLAPRGASPLVASELALLGLAPAPAAGLRAPRAPLAALALLHCHP